MSGSIQSAIWAGYAQVANIFGAACPQYRAAGPMDPMAAQFAALQAAFDTKPDFTFVQPSTYAKPIWYCAADGSKLAVGDYLQHPSLGYFFIASIEPFHPIMAVSCNRTVTVKRPSPTGRGGGKKPYGGDVAATEPVIMQGWPASILQGTKGEKADSGLPGDTRQPWMNILMPAIPAVLILTDDVLDDELGNRYKVSSTELTNLGWRLTAAFAGV
jgi:hypothetical protein